jgi:hypothetical protein
VWSWISRSSRLENQFAKNMGRDLTVMYHRFAEKRFHCNIEQVRRKYRQTHTFHRWPEARSSGPDGLPAAAEPAAPGKLLPRPERRAAPTAPPTNSASGRFLHSFDRVRHGPCMAHQRLPVTGQAQTADAAVKQALPETRFQKPELAVTDG